jgi:hypothetical protein
MPAKKKNGSGTMSKTAFVKSLPTETSVSEVIAKAKEAGLVISKNYVYLIRSKAKHGDAPKAQRPRGRAPSRSPAPRASSSLEAEFQNLVAEIGLSRAEELLRAVRAKFIASAR